LAAPPPGPAEEDLRILRRQRLPDTEENLGQADRPPLMALYLRCVADQVLCAGWEPSNEHLAIMSDETCVGTLVRQIGGTPRRPLVLVDHLRAD
jgi:hypothetical protein